MAQAVNPLASLQTMLRLKSPSNMTPSGDSFLDKRRNQIATGEDELAPSELDQMTGQLALGDAGVGVSREMIRDSGIQRLKQRLGLIEAESQADIAKAVAPARVKGEYDVLAARESAKAAESRAQTQQEAIAARQREMIQAVGGRQDKTIAAQGARQEDAQLFRAGNVNPAAMTAIANERKALAAAQAKNAPGALGKFFGKTDQYQTQLDGFDAALSTAQKILSTNPNATAEEGVFALGENGLTPDELGQVQKFMLLLRGH